MWDEKSLSALPDDPEEALLEFEAIARARMEDAEESRDSAAERLYAQSLLIFQEEYGLNVFRFTDLPTDARSFAEVFREINESMNAMILRKRLRERISKKLSVGPQLRLTPEAKMELHSLLARMREVLNETDLPEAKREAIFNKLNELAAEIDTNRTRWESWAALSILVGDAAEQFGRKVNPLKKLMDSAYKLLGRIRDDLLTLPTPERPKQIEGPKTAQSQSKVVDDEIPF